MRERHSLTIEGDPNPGGGTSNATPPWYAPAESLKTTDPDIWQSFEKGVESGNHKDLPTLVKHTVGLEKKLGSALALPNKDKPEDVAAFKTKLYQSGVLEAPPDSPDKYELDLSAIPEGMRSETTIKAAREWAHKNGVSNGALKELMAIETQRYNSELKPVLEFDKQKSMTEFNTWAASIGKQPDEMMAYGGAYLSSRVSEEGMALLDRAGLSNHPEIMKLIAQAGMDTGEDISLALQARAGNPDALAAASEANDITTNKDNPKYKLLWSGDKATMDYVMSLRAKAHPGDDQQS